MNMENHDPIKILVEIDENLTSNVVTGMPVSRLLDFFKNFPKSERVYLFENIIEDNFDYLIKTEDPVAIKLNTIFKNEKSIKIDTACIVEKHYPTSEGVVNKKRKIIDTEDFTDIRRSHRKKIKTSGEFKEMDKHKTLNEEELFAKFMFHFPDPKFLFLSTTSKIVCVKCLKPNSIPPIKNINGWMHETCKTNENQNCFICRLPIENNTYIEENLIVKCSEKGCEQICHQDCYNIEDSGKQQKCPQHHCLTCSSRNRNYNGALVHCVVCLASFHKEEVCVPAGTQILSQTQIICPRHPPEKNKKRKSVKHQNVDFCNICLDFGSLICCDSCPRSFHTKCIKVNENIVKFNCKDCVKGKMPMYGDIVWSHVPGFRWWPAIILPSIVVPEIILGSQRNKRDFCLRFFGSYDYYWFPSENVLPYEADTQLTGNVLRFNIKFENAIEEANKTMELKRKFEVPPENVWKKTITNRVVTPVALKKSKIEDISVCKCNFNDENPCGKTSACINRDLFYECNKSLCPAGDRCQNQAMQKRNYAKLSTVKTLTRGTGVETTYPLERGDFIIEYVGEIINATEFNQRLTQKVTNFDNNFYFMSLTKNLYIDAEFFGNISRFFNHSCEPNCETRKIMVDGKTRIGLFSKQFIEKGTELTFDYHMEIVGNNPMKCLCGSDSCLQFIQPKKKSN